MDQKYIVWFNEVGKKDIPLVGGKGANLGEMTQSNFPIPYGFILTSHTYFHFIEKAKLENKIKSFLLNVNYDNNQELQQVSSHIQSLILNAEIPNILTKKVIQYYENIQTYEDLFLNNKLSFLKKISHPIRHLYHPPLVAVRSSATAEDLPNASFAGQQETYLNVKGESHLLKKVKECWASLFTPRALYYRHEQGYDRIKVGLAVVVQRMVQSEKSGIAFSIDPVTNDKNKIVIEAILGLGEYIVQGKVTPDHYEVDKNSLVILKKENKYQNLKYIKAGLFNKKVRLSKTAGSIEKLDDQEITKIAILVKEIESHYYFPQDIEWAIENNRVFIVQSRPITTINSKNKSSNNQGSTSNTPILTGSPAAPGIGIGIVKIIHSPKEIDKIKKGDILVAPQTNPDYVPAMKRAAAIITEKGGRTSHAAIVSRELGIPAVVGVDDATKILKNGEVISVNGKTGEIFKGSILTNPKSKIQNPKLEKTIKKLKTITKVYVNLAEPEKAYKIARMDVDGVGLLRAEFMIAEIGVHPKEFIKEKKQQIFIKKLTSDLLKFVKPFSPRPVIYRATDFKTNEYRHLKGGAHWEPKEENPMIGFRGASRYIADPQVFMMELEAIKNIHEMGYQNLHLMIPFIRVPWELIKIKEIVSQSGLFNLPHFKFLIMVEVPYCALNIEEFIKVGIDGVSIGTNDLTMMLLGVDRDNQEISQIYDERNPMIITTLEYIVKTCTKQGITSSICGQAASDYPEIAERLVRAGITSLSVNPDVVVTTRELIYNIENKHFNKI